MNIYITKRGDTFDTIAYEQYGDEELMGPIETAVFEEGIRLEVPELEKTDESIFLPPWRRG